MEDILREKGIVGLFHFTQVDNLPSIFKYGLMSRDTLENNEIEHCFNDEHRYDRCRDAVCISISFPNYKMFYKLRRELPEKDWVVIRLDPKVLCDFECAFCWTNAGDSLSYNMSIEDRMGEEAFLRLFEDKKGYPNRKKLGIPDKYPTNPQAEVLVFDTIPIDYITKIYFEKEKVLNRYNDLVFPEHIKEKVFPKAFSYRKDWEFWKV